MKIPLSWLKEYVDIDCSTKDFMHVMTMSGSKVEGCEITAKEIENVVVGKIVSLQKHENADKLVVATIDCGKEENIMIVTGANNLYEGAYVPVALPGATLFGGLKIKESVLRGVPSFGMLCSIQELGYDTMDFPEASEDGIYIFEQEYPLGSDAKEALEIVDEVVEYEITSNRPDCFSVIGIAREAAAVFDKELKFPKIEVAEVIKENVHQYMEIEIQNPHLCPRYTARVIKNVTIEPSPRWMRRKLRAAGIRPINNIVDITNFVMLELGQPMHAFDVDMIEGRRIIVRNAEDGEKFVTLDKMERALDSSMLVIADKNKAVGIAGVMGGENSKVTGTASAVLFESANFNGPNIRITAKKLGLRTDASSKYEKGIDAELALAAVNRAAQLVELLGAGDVVSGVIDCYPNKAEKRRLPYNPAHINNLLGINISKGEMATCLERLAIQVDRENNEAIIPTFRPDLEIEADIAEEVGRIYGYDKIVPTLAAGTPTVGKKNAKQQLEDVIRNNLTSQGLCEAMTFSFESPKVFDKLNIPQESQLRKAVVIRNPLGEDFSIMRTTTLNGMLSSLSVNYNRRNESCALFEIGKIYLSKEEPLTQLPEEKVFITLGMYGDMDFYTIKGIVESLFMPLGMRPDYQRTSWPWMHPGRTAEITFNGVTIGYVGEVHPRILSSYEIEKESYIAVIDFGYILQYANLKKVYRPLPKYPAVTRDIALIVAEGILVKEIETAIKNEGGLFLEDVHLFDVYKGKQVADGFKSVAYSITFRAKDKTLVDKEVNEAMSAIVAALEKMGAQLRDK